MIRPSMPLIAVVVSLVICASPAFAQTTRVESIAEQQAEKAKRLGVEGPSQGELIVRRVLLSPLLSGGDGMYPWFGSVFSGTGMAIGAGYLKRLESAARVNLVAGISLNNSMMLRAEATAPELWRGKLVVDGFAQWLDARAVSFYGFGQDSTKDARERYDFKPLELSATATMRPTRRVSLAGSYSFLGIDTARELPRFTPEEMPGIDQNLEFQVVRASAVFDWRNSPGYSTRGGYYRATVDRHHEQSGLPYSFNATEFEVLQLVPLVREQFVIAARGLMTLATPDSGHEIPVMVAPFLGSGSTLRGYSNRRFTDYNRLLLSGEYRWRPSRYLDMALFVDAGQVARDRSALTLSELETDYGIGARFHGPNFTALRIEVARGSEGIRLIFAGSQAF
jgi:outer membrane translocation and assembly module TamA